MAREGGARQAESAPTTIWEYHAVNRLTGEVVDLLPRGDVKRGWSQHVKLFQRAMGRLGREGKIGKEGWRVLAFLLERLDWDNWIVIPQREVADALAMQRQNVSRAVAQLIGGGIVLQAAPPAPRTAYRLSAEFAYRGQYNGWQKRRREEQAERDAQHQPGATPALCPHCGTQDTLRQAEDGRVGCVACDRWVEMPVTEDNQ